MEPSNPAGANHAVRANSMTDHEMRVVDDLPPEFPMTTAEIDLVLAFLRDTIADIMRGEA